MKNQIKKLMCFLLAVCMSISLFSYSVFAEESEPGNVVRYTVLILDTSGSMRGTPLSVQKEAAVKFCESVTGAEGSNYVAIVKLNTSSSIGCEFTDDLQIMTDYINSIPANGGTNINQALEVSGELLDKITTDGVIKNIVLCSDGLPEDGTSTENGKYTSADHPSCYGYGNACINTADSLKAKKYNIYTLGFFHSLSGTNLTFGRQLMKDIASSESQYYEVTDASELEFTFGEIAEDITSDTEDKDPVIVIPGIMGSRLWTSSECTDSTRVWDPVASGSGLLFLRAHISDELYVRPCENQRVCEKREYGTQDTYQYLVDTLCDKLDEERPVYVFSYDWRKSNSESAEKLIVEIEKILQENNAESVDLVCHSMGGLVASSCYGKLKNSNDGDRSSLIDKIITCGTPYEGAPKVFNSVLNWDVLGDEAFNLKAEDLIGDRDNQDFLLGLVGGLSKKTKGQFLGVAELTPTENYVDTIAMKQDSLWPFSLGDYDLTYDDYKEVCGKIFENFDKVPEFQKSLLDSNEYNRLLNYDNAYFAVGIGQPTIVSVKFQRFGQDLDETFIEDDLNYSMKGDGTVPFLSASIMEQMNKIDSERWIKRETDHGGLVKNVKNNAVDWVVDILETGKSSVQGDELKPGKYIVIRIACPVDVTIDKNSEILSSELDNLSISSSFGRLDVLGENDEIKMLCVVSDSDYKVTLNGTGEGTMDFAIRFFDEDNLLYDERTFENVPITEDTVIYTGTDENQDTVLEIDSNGDGTIDNTWSAGENEDVTEPDIVHSHNYVASFTWSDDNQTCVATFTCSECGESHSVDAEVTEEITPATCTEDGKIVYKATAQYEDYTASTLGETVVIPATGHNFENNVCTVCGEKENVEIPSEPESPEETGKPAETVKPIWKSWFEKWFGCNDNTEEPTESETSEEVEPPSESDTSEETPTEPESESEADTDTPGTGFWDWIFEWWR